jgi:phosphate:Na+ symporter
MEKGDYNAQSGLIYSNIFSSIERVGDHIINVSEAASGQYLN